MQEERDDANYVLGLDISTTCVGWALISLEYEKDHLLWLGKIIPPKGTKKEPVSWFERAKFIHTAIEQLIENRNIAAIAVEQLNSMRGGDTTRQLAGMSMSVQFLLFKKLGIEPSEIFTSTMKKGFTGNGAAKKWDMIAHANKTYGTNLRWPTSTKDQKNKELNDEDVADALAAAHCFLEEVGEDLRDYLRIP